MINYIINLGGYKVWPYLLEFLHINVELGT
jgi:hypothetical protein